VDSLQATNILETGLVISIDRVFFNNAISFLDILSDANIEYLSA